MTKNMRRALGLIAALDFTPKEAEMLLLEVKESSISEMMGVLAEFRRLIAERENFGQKELRFDTSVKHEKIGFGVGERVNRLLRDEARLGTQEAVKELTDLVVRAGLIEEAVVPPLSRKSFAAWVDRLSAFVAEKELLRLATILRNKHVHSPRADWVLSERQK